MTDQPTHTPRGAFNSFQGLQVASNLGLNLRKRSPDNTTKSTHKGLHKGPKQRTRPQSKTQFTSMTNTKLKQIMQDSNLANRVSDVLDCL